MFKLLDGSQTLGRGMDFLVLLPRRAGGRADLSGLCGFLRRRQFLLFPDLDIHGARSLPDVGIWRHAVVRPDALLRHLRLCLWRARHQHGRRVGDDRRARPVDRHCDDRGGYPRLLHDLGRHQRHLLRHRHPVGDAGAGVLPGTDRRAGMAHRPRAPERLQRHEGHGSARRRRSLYRGIRALLRHDRADRDRLPRASHAGEFVASAT